MDCNFPKNPQLKNKWKYIKPNTIRVYGIGTYSVKSTPYIWYLMWGHLHGNYSGYGV